MNWSKWSSIAEIVSSVAILVTLFYLALEINQNTNAIQSDARDGIMQADVEWLYKQVNDPELNVLFHKAEPLSDLEAVKVHTYLIAFVRLREANYRQYVSGVLDEETWVNYRSSIVAGPLATRNGRNWWANIGHALFDQELVSQITEALETAPLPAPYTDYFLPASQD
jgi:hypothetical protein